CRARLRLADRLRPFGEKPPGRRPSGARGQLPGGHHPWCAVGEDLLRDQADFFASWAGTFCLASSTSAVNAVVSLTARSARILRSTSTSAAFRPWMKRLYVMPWARAAALIRWIHRRRKSPFLALRSLYE